MNIKLRYPATPEFASQHAEVIVQTVLKFDNFGLDYSPESLQKVDDIIERFRQGGAKEDDNATTLFLFGCYLGEVLVRNCGARWVSANEELRVLDDWPMFVQLPWGTFCNPLRKPYKRLTNGLEDSLPYFYQLFSVPSAES